MREEIEDSDSHCSQGKFLNLQRCWNEKKSKHLLFWSNNCNFHCTCRRLSSAAKQVIYASYYAKILLLLLVVVVRVYIRVVWKDKSPVVRFAWMSINTMMMCVN